MNNKSLVTRTTQRINTQQGWLIQNPVLYAGEIGIESDTTRVKVGDGITPWNSLTYWVNDDQTYTAGTGVNIDGYSISLLLLYEKLRMPNIRIRTAELYGISTTDDSDVYTEF